jgi:hypothetical protein
MHLADCWRDGAGRTDVGAGVVGQQDNTQTLRRGHSQRNHE